MPKGPRVSQAARLEWLEAHERGQRIDAIAHKARRTERTVREHIELARQEREHREARVALLREVYQRHYDDLLSFAQELGKAAGTLTSGVLRPASNRRWLLLWEALRSHIPTSNLWKECRKWEDSARRMADTEARARAHIAALIETEVRSRFPEARPDLLANTLWYAMDSAVRGGAASLQGMNYDVKAIPGGLRVTWGDSPVAELEGPDQERATELVEAHRRLVVRVTSWEWVPAMAEASRQWNQARDAIDQELELLLLRRLLPGRCNLCPGSQPAGGRKPRARREP